MLQGVGASADSGSCIRNYATWSQRLPAGLHLHAHRGKLKQRQKFRKIDGLRLASFGDYVKSVSRLGKLRLSLGSGPTQRDDMGVGVYKLL